MSKPDKDLTEAELNETIEGLRIEKAALETRIDHYLRLRAGKMHDEETGWCVGCGDMLLFPGDGQDTCSYCLEG